MTPKFRREDRRTKALKVNPTEAARHPLESITNLSCDLLVRGLLNPITVDEDDNVLAGNGRTLAALMAKLETVPVNVLPGPHSPTQIKLIRASENMQRTDYTPYQKWLLASELMAENPWSQKELSEHLHLSEGMVSKILSPSKVTDGWRKALEEGAVSLLDVVAASKLPLADQPGLLALRLGEGGSLKQVEAAVLAKKRPVKAATKVNRVKCQVTAATTLTVTGPEMTLSDLIETLAAVLSSARAALKDSQDIKSFELVLKNRAKKPEGQ